MRRALQQYITVTLSYWGFTITDGALRMLVVLYFHQLGYSPFEVASLFLFYEFFGMVTNLLGGWLAARAGLNTTLHIGMILQMLALTMLLVDPAYLSVLYVMAAQAISGIAKDLNKMTAKSSIKLLVPETMQSQLYRWIALLTGSKNALKGAGFFLGAVLLSSIGFRGALLVLLSGLMMVCVLSFLLLDRGAGTTTYVPKFRDMLSKSAALNRLSAARLFLFGARDIWFVVALPVYLQSQLGWSHTDVGGFLALWIIGYGGVQSIAPKITGTRSSQAPDGRTAWHWALPLCVIPGLIAMALGFTDISEEVIVIGGLLVFGFVFAINSSVHSFLIVAYAKQDGVSLDVGFYYMANAAGRLAGTVLSGLIYQWQGLAACLAASSCFLIITLLVSLCLPHRDPNPGLSMTPVNRGDSNN